MQMRRYDVENFMERRGLPLAIRRYEYDVLYFPCLPSSVELALLFILDGLFHRVFTLLVCLVAARKPVLLLSFFFKS